MKKEKRYRSNASESVHRLMSDVHEAGLIDKTTMKSFDDLCLTTVEELSPDEIVRIRLRENVSQAVFAQYLNVSVFSVSQWERGIKKPAGPALKLLTLVAKKGLAFIS